MTHRLDVGRSEHLALLEFQGLLDAGALESLRAAVAAARASGVRARVLLRAGTEIERSCLAALRALDAEIVAEAAYVERWLRDQL